jgi:AmiR/NasT family two-component response regulator
MSPKAINPKISRYKIEHNMIEQKPLRVLIADDQETMSALIRHQLIKIGHVVVGKATNGREAVELTLLQKPDIVLLDIEMPEMDGLEAARLIQEKCPRPVVLLTGHDDPEMVRRASQVGVGAYLIKPPSAPELERTMIIAIARFADLMELRRLNIELQSALDNVKVLSGLLPICANCKKIRDDKGYWEAVETYFKKHTEIEFSHGLCPACITKLYPEYKPKKK